MRAGRDPYRANVGDTNPSEPLDGRRFSWSRRADGTVIVSYNSAPVRALRGRAADRFVARIAAAADEPAAQELMARATGSLKGAGR